MKILIIEDEALLAGNLEHLIYKCAPDAEIMATLTNIDDSVEFLKRELPDIILSDIELSDGQSFSIFNQVEIKCPIIFTTAYDEYALQAFRANAIDYLLKPIEEPALQEAMLKALRYRDKKTDFKEKYKGANYRKRFLVQSGRQLIPLSVINIAYFKVAGSICFVTTKDNKQYIINLTLDEIASQLNSDDFFKINRQFIVSHESIKKITFSSNGKLEIGLYPGTREMIFVSKEKATYLKQWLDA